MSGVRPNSPIHTTRVFASMPRSFRSASSVANAGSSVSLSVLTCSKLFAVRVPAVERDLDERHAAFDQPAGEQAALAEAVPAVGVAELGGLLVQPEAAAGLGVDHLLGLAVAGGVGLGRGAAVALLEVPLQVGEQLPADVLVVGGDRPVGLQVVDRSGWRGRWGCR